MKKLLSILVATSLFALNSNELKEFEIYKYQTSQQFENYKKNLDRSFKEYVETLNKAFFQYKKELSKYWPHPELSSKKVFVEYSKDKKVKEKVDYEKEFIEIAVIAKNKKEAEKLMLKYLYNLTTETTAEAVYNNPVLEKVNKKLVNNPSFREVIKQGTPSNEPIVADLLFQKPPTKKDVSNFVISQIKHGKIGVMQSKIKNELIYNLKIQLPPNSILRKAKRYKKDVFERASQFKLTTPLIYAIIHTESCFNPMATSYVPAFGLMQIVPMTAGADAYEMLYGVKKVLTPAYLYNPHNNILIGSAYLNKIYYDYLKTIDNPLTRLYCAIASYNTGVGNVACAFNSTKKELNGTTICSRSQGDYDIVKASQKINSMTPQQVYNHLLKNLRYDETKNYLKRVTKRYLIYSEAQKHGKI